MRARPALTRGARGRRPTCAGDIRMGGSRATIGAPYEARVGEREARRAAAVARRRGVEDHLPRRPRDHGPCLGGGDDAGAV
jgi:hypothetical protein